MTNGNPASGVRPGMPLLPGYGAVVDDDTGTQFSLVSRYATAVTLLLFDHADDDRPSREIELDAEHYRQGDLWSVYVPGIMPGQLYLFRVDGPWAPDQGLWFNPHRPMLDPYARAITGSYDRAHGDPRTFNASAGPREMAIDNHLRGMPKCVVVRDEFDWQGDRPINRPMQDTVIYEVHVKGFTAHASSAVEHPGTYRGLIERIPYLTDLGITAVELMPVQQFETYNHFRSPGTGQELTNYWGYDPTGFFAPHAQYAADGALGQQVAEFREMVRALHAAGIEVILDVVFNHTAEGNHLGPSLAFRGLDNPIWYMLEPDAPMRYRNYTGVGNTVNCNHPVVRQMILNCLHYWVLHMHVDGFRFDLASVLGRDTRGNLLPNPPLIEAIAEDPVLRDTKIIAEAWDAGGAYQIGEFPGRWAEWNGHFRDDVRRFWLHGDVTIGQLATRLSGSSDLYDRGGRTPLSSINFVTCHDGFTLWDLVSYDRKHNAANGEDNRDGANDNHSNNHGTEGPSDNPGINAIRRRQVRNLAATLLLSQGVPMLLGGDEFLRTQGGNNNAYCQDNELSWFDWRRAGRNQEFVRFIRELVAFRRGHPGFRRCGFFRGSDNDNDRILDVAWLNADGREHDWHADSRVLMVLMDGSRAETGGEHDNRDALLLINGHNHDVQFTLPRTPEADMIWRVYLDTAQSQDHGINPARTGRIVIARTHYQMQAKSLALLLAVQRPRPPRWRGRK